MEPLLSPIDGAHHQQIGGMEVDTLTAANGRIKRLIYPPGFRWSTDLKHLVETDFCMHAHVGFLAQGRVQGVYADGCTFNFAAPQAVVIEPGHDAWVVGDETAVMIQFDFATKTANHFGLPETHHH